MMHLQSDGVANIGERERRQRYVMGLVMLGVSAGLLILLGRSAVSRWWRLWLMVPLWVSMLGFAQARAQTWVVLAARGARRLQGQEERLASPSVIQQVRRQARRVSLTAILLALVLTGVCVLMPM